MVESSCEWLLPKKNHPITAWLKVRWVIILLLQWRRCTNTNLQSEPSITSPNANQSHSPIATLRMIKSLSSSSTLLWVLVHIANTKHWATVSMGFQLMSRYAIPRNVTEKLQCLLYWKMGFELSKFSHDLLNHADYSTVHS